jgi:hypothetical protein
LNDLDLDLPLAAALAATGWREREAALVTAASRLAAATNDLGLCPPLDPAPRQFHTRDIRVLNAERFTTALCAEITDPVLREVLDRVGARDGIPRLPGTIDQAVDSTDVLTDPARWRAAAALLALPPGRAVTP